MDQALHQALTTLITEARARGAVFLLLLTWDTEGRGKAMGFAALTLPTCDLAGDQLS